MERSDKCAVSKAHVTSSCRKSDGSDVKDRLLNKVNGIHLKKNFVLISIYKSKIRVTMNYNLFDPPSWQIL